MMASIFSKIIAGEIPSFKIAEDEDFYAFLDVFPLVKGHTLVVPKKEIDYVFDMDDDLYGKYNLFAKKIAYAIKNAIPCKKVGMAVIGLEVPHAHIHLVPMNSLDDLNFSRDKLQLPKEEMDEIARKIRNEL
jgi:histidine triad (HIT) family protein